ncbi:Protein PLASTID MOVEMENT IMPAIRED 1-RELATED 1 [Euphorbia peplus]|nr:Protein PLASTID MOVEMENT IMPAIRED 1-RELATED 1 [Euphorbia peplus]
MMSKFEGRKKLEEDSGNTKLLKEIETISKALYLEKTHPRTPNFRSKSGKFPPVESKPKLRNVNEDLSKEKKSIWNWKPLKAFSNVKNRKFNCCFSLVVHSIEGFPLSFEDVHVSVYWKRRDGELVTKPVKVSGGVAEFEEKLTHTCMVYGSRSGAHHSAKYEAKHFLLFASAVGYRELDLGKHRVDLTRLLPLTLEELEEEKSSGNWTTSFKLSGEAKGAKLNVSFGYTVIGESPASHGNNQNVPEGYSVKKSNSRITASIPKPVLTDGKSRMRRTGSLPGTLGKQILAPSQSTEDGRDLRDVLQTSKSELASSKAFLFPTVDAHKVDSSFDCMPEPGPLSKATHESIENECEDGEFSATEQRLELSKMENDKEEEKPVAAVEVSLLENIDGSLQVCSEEGAQLGLGDVGHGGHEDDNVEESSNFDEHDICSRESVMKALEDALINVTNLEAEAFSSPEDEEKNMEADDEKNENETSLSLDDATDSVANEFLDMLGIEHSPFGLSSESEPESPRERLLRQFEKDALAGGYSLFDFDMGDSDQIECDHNSSAVSEWGNLSEDFELSSVIQAVEEEYQMGNQAESGKTSAKVIEDLETEALMREWGLNDKAFQCSPPKGSSGFGSPIDLPPELPLELPSLGEGLGPFLQTKNGGFLRSMNPSLFRNAKTGGSLIMQVSSPVVVPAEMGSGTAEILQQLASVGIEKLSMQANKLMPLDDITGKTMQQVAWEEAASLEGPESQGFLQHEVEIVQDNSSGQKNVKKYSAPPRSDNFKSNKAGNGIGSEYVSLEDLAPLAMDKIEALSMEGLRVQSGMSNEDASANINAQPAGEISGFQGKAVNASGSLGLEGAAGLQLLDIKDDGGDIEGLMGLSLTLDEWMRLDSGDVGDEGQISEQTSKILAAHHASSLDMIRGGSKGERRRGKGSGKKCGLLGNNFTVALMVQLHDPLRNYEPVGAPMLALIQVERVFIPPKPKIYCNVSEVRIKDEDDDESELVAKVMAHDEKIGGKTSEEEGTPQFCITEVQVSGLKTEPSKNKIWGNTAQQQSGSRWLLANGMGKNNKNPFVKSKGISDKPGSSLMTKAQRGDKLWSVSSRKGAK